MRRKQVRGQVVELWTVKNGRTVYHLNDAVYGTKVCDAYQMVGNRQVIWARGDKVVVVR